MSRSLPRLNANAARSSTCIKHVTTSSHRSFASAVPRPSRKKSVHGKSGEWHDNRQRVTSNLDWEALDRTPLEQKTLSKVDKMAIPHLAHGLEKVVQEESLLHPLRDLATSDFNFSQSLHKLKPLKELDLSSIGAFTPPAQDPKLQSLAVENNCTVLGSTSSVTPILSKIYLYLSNQRPCDLPEMSSKYAKASDTVVASLQRLDSNHIIFVNPKHSICIQEGAHDHCFV